jgi:hypothetical protein
VCQAVANEYQVANAPGQGVHLDDGAAQLLRGVLGEELGSELQRAVRLNFVVTKLYGERTVLPSQSRLDNITRNDRNWKKIVIERTFFSGLMKAR